MGLGAYPAPDDQWLGMLGMHGTRAANYAMDEADLIVSIGARFDDRITGKLDEFAPRAKFIHIDVDPAEIGKNVPAHIPIVGDAGDILPKLTREYRALETDGSRLDEWWESSAAGRLSTRSATTIRPTRDQARVHGRGAVPRHRRQGDHHLRRRSAPDVGGAVLPLRRAASVAQLGRPRDHGLRPSGRDRRQGRAARRHRRLPRRRRQPDHGLPGDGNRRRAQPRRQGHADEQRPLRHGPPVAGALLGGAIPVGEDGLEP